MASPTTYGLAVLLLASLALNARLWTARGAPAEGRGKTVASAQVAVQEEPSGCERRLQTCEQRSWTLAQRMIAAASEPRPAGTAAPATGASDPAAQASALCSKAEEHLRDSWKRDKDKIAWGLKHYVSDKDEQERSVARDVAKMREVAGLDDREAGEVARALRERRAAQVAEADAALGKTPPDFSTLFDSTRKLLADEDAIVARVSGPGARDAWRSDQLDSRTVLLALVASMAGKDWDEDIRW
jgi:hypothetical protein